MSEDSESYHVPVAISANGQPPAPRLVASVYIEFIANGAGLELQPRMLGFIPDVAAEACAQILEKIALDMRSHASRIIRPPLVV